MAKVGHNQGSAWLLAGALLSIAAGLLHIAVIVGGPDWYRFFGAPEGYALAVSRGELFPAIVTLGIATILFIWSAFALSGGGYIVRLPLLRIGLAGITLIYLLRGALIVPVILYVPYPQGAFDYWSSAIVLVYGLIHAVGLLRAWRNLAPSAAPHTGPINDPLA